MFRRNTWLALALILPPASAVADGSYNNNAYAKSLLHPKEDFSGKNPVDMSLWGKAVNDDRQAQFEVALHYAENGQRQKAVHWLKCSAEGGLADAQLSLADLYLNGAFKELPADNKEALFWAKKAADGNHPQAQTMMAQFYLEGKIVEANDEEAFRWLKKAANNGEKGSELMMGYFYLLGRGVAQDTSAGLAIFDKLMAEKFEPAFIELYKIYSDGTGVVKDDARAIKILQMGADAGLEKPAQMLGICYQLGSQTPKNLELAYATYAKAENFGWDTRNFLKSVEKEMSPEELKSVREKYPLKAKK